MRFFFLEFAQDQGVCRVTATISRTKLKIQEVVRITQAMLRRVSKKFDKTTRVHKIVIARACQALLKRPFLLNRKLEILK